jgi:predicted nucleic acid-binding Zn ribbon protein
MTHDRSLRPTRLGDVLRGALERLPFARQLADYALWSHWDAVVGPTVARHARPQRLQRGVLVVVVDSVEWMQELQFLKHELRERLNARLGRAAIRDVFLVLATDP